MSGTNIFCELQSIYGPFSKDAAQTKTFDGPISPSLLVID